MARNSNARGVEAAGANDDVEAGPSVPRPPADEDRIAELAARDDWRDAVEALGLPERESYELRVAVLRRRTFGATARGARARRGRR